MAASRWELDGEAYRRRGFFLAAKMGLVFESRRAAREFIADWKLSLSIFQGIREASGGRPLLSCIETDNRRISSSAGEQAGERAGNTFEDAIHGKRRTWGNFAVPSRPDP